jgi:protease-4
MVPEQRNRTAVYVTVAVAALLVGSVLAPFVWGAASEPDGTVAVVTLEGSIAPQSAEPVIERLDRARTNDSIDAVVFRVNSPGGRVPASESLYMAVHETAAEKPVVTSVAGQAASGGYMAALGSDYIYTTPSSQLGSVGVFATVPIIQPSNVDGIVTTARTKGTPGTPAEVRQSVEQTKHRFVDLVVEERGSALTVSEQAISRAKVYDGSVAVENGFADAVGGRAAAVRAAADRAKLESYRTVSLGPEQPRPRPLSLTGQVDTVRYYALHGVPDEMAVTPGDVEAERNTTVEPANRVDAADVGGERR